MKRRSKLEKTIGQVLQKACLAFLLPILSLTPSQVMAAGSGGAASSGASVQQNVPNGSPSYHSGPDFATPPSSSTTPSAPLTAPGQPNGTGIHEDSGSGSQPPDWSGFSIDRAPLRGPIDIGKNPSGLAPNQPPASGIAPPLVSGSVEFNEGIPDYPNLPPLTPVDALNEALINGPRAAAIRAQFGIVQAGYAAATQAPNPVFMFDRGIVAEQENRIGPILTEELPFKLLFRLIIQKRLVDQTRTDLMNQLWQLRASVRRAYTEVVVAQETYKTLTDLFALSSRLEQVTRRQLNAGLVPGLDVLKAKLATSQTGVDRVVGAQRVLRARQQLNIIMGRPFDAQYNVRPLPDFTSGRTPDPTTFQTSDLLPDFSQPLNPVTSYLQLALANRLELKSLYQQLRLNDAQLKAAYGNIIPNPTLALGKSYGGNVPTGPKLTAVFFTVNAGMPMTDLNQGNIAFYKATAKQLRLQITSQRNQIAEDVATDYQNLISARDRLRLYQDQILSESARVARLAQRSYAVGQSDITSTLAAQQANVQTRSAYLDAVQAYESAFIDLEQACGVPLD